MGGNRYAVTTPSLETANTAVPVTAIPLADGPVHPASALHGCSQSTGNAPEPFLGVGTQTRPSATVGVENDQPAEQHHLQSRRPVSASNALTVPQKRSTTNSTPFAYT